MKSNYEQLDKFNEEICKWDVYQDILPYKDTVVPKTTFYSTEEYTQYQK